MSQKLFVFITHAAAKSAKEYFPVESFQYCLIFAMNKSNAYSEEVPCKNGFARKYWTSLKMLEKESHSIGFSRSISSKDKKVL
jgi:hypothetical protein